MDFISHVLVGKMIQTSSRAKALKDRLIIILFAFLPDVPLIPLYLILGLENNRPLGIAHATDWLGLRETHPAWAMTWEIPHSILFLLLVIIPLVLWLKWPKIAIVSYSSHLTLDLLTHAGEWAMKPLYPINYTLEGFTNAWAWPLYYITLSWFALGLAINIICRKKLCKSDHLTDRVM